MMKNGKMLPFVQNVLSILHGCGGATYAKTDSGCFLDNYE